jgi:hypothetical protein
MATPYSIGEYLQIYGSGLVSGSSPSSQRSTARQTLFGRSCSD